MLRQTLYLFVAISLLVFGFSKYQRWAERGSVLSAVFVSQSAGRSSSFDLEIAATPGAREKGLMFRRELGASKGMIFIYPTEDVHYFWMKNTYISLDMIFVDNQGKIVGIEPNVPILNEVRRGVPKPSKYVIEVVAGTAARLGLAPGDSIETSPELRSLTAR